MILDFLTFSLFSPSFLFAFLVWLVAHRTLVKQRMANAGRISAAIALSLFCWFFFVILVSRTGLFVVNPLFAPNIALGFLLLFELIRRVYASHTIQRIAANAPMWFLIVIQTYRIVGVAFFTFYARGLLPAEFAIPAGVGDILVGITAPLVAAIYYFRKSYGKRLAILWNYVGILDLIVAIGVGILSFSRPIEFLHTTPSTEQIALFPLAIVPLFAVPLALLLHMLCLKVLKSQSIL